MRGFGVGRVRILRAFLLSGGALTRLGESSSAPALARLPCTSPLPGGIVHAVRADAPGRGFVVVLAAGARPSLVAVAVRILVPALVILFASVLRAGGRVHPDPQVPVGESPGRIPAGVRTPPRPSSTPPRRGRRGSSPAAPPEPAGQVTISRARTVILRTRPEAGWDGAGTGTRSATTPS